VAWTSVAIARELAIIVIQIDTSPVHQPHTPYTRRADTVSPV
jgi:hypothetical protein